MLVCRDHCIPLLQVRPFINEAHYYADATLMFPVWPPESKAADGPDTSETGQQHAAGEKRPQEITTWGLWLAEHLWKEIQQRLKQQAAA